MHQVGQRPEDRGQVSCGEGDFNGKVYSSELLGDYVLVSVGLGKEIITVKVGPQEQHRVGDAVGIRVDRERLHLFDAESGERLACRGA